MKKFEYKVVEIFLEEGEMNELGLEGWELVSYIGPGMYSSRSYIFKREIK
jgi:hypothetical protein